MSNEKPKIHKRIIAFIIDLLVVTLLSGLISSFLTNEEAYNKDTQELFELVSKTTSGEITNEEYNKQYQELSYSLNVDSLPITLITIGVTVVYYVIMLYFANGITLGKYIMKLRIVSANDKELNMFNYLLRSLIVNSLLANLVTVLMIKFLSKDMFISIYSKVSSVFSLLLIIAFIFIMYREDGRGLHDLIGNTKVVELNNLKNEDYTQKEEVKDAMVIEEVKKSKVNKKEGK